MSSKAWRALMHKKEHKLSKWETAACICGKQEMKCEGSQEAQDLA